MFKSEMLDELRRIRLAIESQSSGVLEDFKAYLVTLKDLGPFSLTSWPMNFRQEVYRFGETFAKRDAGEFLREITSAEELYTDGIEIYGFFKSEIVWNFFEQNNEYNRKLLREFTRRFPENPEFHHSYSHFLAKNGSSEQALFEVLTSLKIDPGNFAFINTYAGRLKNHFEQLLSSGKIEAAESFLHEQNNKIHESDSLRSLDLSWFRSLRDRLKDYKMMKNRIDFFEKEIESKINREQKRLIEVLGIFAAIISFILTSINIGISGLNIRDMLMLMIGMALILMIFSVSISYLFGARRGDDRFFSFMREKKFYSVLLLVIFLFLLFLKV